ncbi:hypothetical protein BABINDRAFT_172352 [Babjeviella inositovora NRRL Y-12698]|uniref:Uncharacterized protein n=1 Tax=Babjeviella inositovora NRRL Y-12698 TaxID=984486 RepID=A0A1E3QM88_9ASCO|nr:uncharacterized protein BABINDRAFT_172352 [Babjeviella inositovora NRRL Y-12698]ODQ78202.1 hypothetical protein BABINDRAFT_172352 [Babjeviella inositovora NRRL Y-12698]
MSLVHGYSSSEDETDIPALVLGQSVDPTPVAAVVVLEVARPSAKRTFASTVSTHHYDDAVFNIQHRDFDRARVQPQTRQQKKLAKRQRENGPFGHSSSSEEEQEIVDEEEIEDSLPVLESDRESDGDSDSATTKFFGESEVDYLGRTYMHVPVDFPKVHARECFVPKTCSYVWRTAHARGVNKLLFFPSGHLLLSCGNDATVKLWDVSSKELLRGFYGHTKPVKSIVFNASGSDFISCGYDRKTHVWDVETGVLKHTFHTRGIPNAALFNPNSELELIVGCSDSKIYHYDTRSPPDSQIIQTYDYHLASVQSLVAIDGQTRFMSTSEDKSVRMWDWGVNVPVKNISDPAQFNMPCVALHPKGDHVACQGMDNKVHTVLTTGKYRLNRRKYYTGHQSQGYNIGVGFSPDGKTLMSGDSRGRAWFWDWSSARVVKSLQVDPKGGVVSCVAANPLGVSECVFAGGSGDIYYYE